MTYIITKAEIQIRYDIPLGKKKRDFQLAFNLNQT